MSEMLSASRIRSFRCQHTYSIKEKIYSHLLQTNKMADAAKRKRLNRNFFDIIEKAKW